MEGYCIMACLKELAEGMVYCNAHCEYRRHSGDYLPVLLPEKVKEEIGEIFKYSQLIREHESSIY